MIANKAEDLAKNKLKELNKGFTLLHTKAAVEIGLEIARMLKNKHTINLDALKAGIWLHDIGRYINEKKHKDIGWSVIADEFKNMTPKTKRIVKDCIKNHSVDRKPKTLEGKIARDSELLSYLNPRVFLLYRKLLIKECGERGNEIAIKRIYEAKKTHFPESKTIFKNKVKQIRRFL